MSEEYNGWTNRETWAVNLWVSNDEGLQNLIDEVMKDNYDAEGENYRLDEVYQNMIESLFDDEIMTDGLKMMKDDIGSMWRVNWGELRDSWIEANA